MSKKFLSGFAVLAIAAVAAWNVNFNSQTNIMSDIALANVEALASSEITEADCDRLCRYSDVYECYLENLSTGETKTCNYTYPRGY